VSPAVNWIRQRRPRGGAGSHLRPGGVPDGDRPWRIDPGRRRRHRGPGDAGTGQLISWSGPSRLQIAWWSGPRHRGMGPCGKTDRANDAPVPGAFGAVLDDEADRTYVDVAFGQLRAERVNDGLGGLARRAVVDRDVRSPARGLAIRCVRPGDLMSCGARGVLDRRRADSVGVPTYRPPTKVRPLSRHDHQQDNHERPCGDHGGPPVVGAPQTTSLDECR
jgi:hypothetical protein